jgi:hypothetical protein
VSIRFRVGEGESYCILRRIAIRAVDHGLAMDLLLTARRTRSAFQNRILSMATID